MSIHVYPVKDEREHELDGLHCWCGPKVLFSDPDTGQTYSEALVVHAAADCREVIEEAEEIINSEGRRNEQRPA
uniref:Uncharacterized protein n=1 Tax=viral metagenome TaxID=1070528 RepID=A0A6M3KT53_9ZZZZ